MPRYEFSEPSKQTKAADVARKKLFTFSAEQLNIVADWLAAEAADTSPTGNDIQSMKADKWVAFIAKCVRAKANSRS